MEYEDFVAYNPFEFEIERFKEYAFKFFIVFTGTLSIIGFFVSLAFLSNMTLTGNVIGNNSSNNYSIVFFILIFLIWSIVMILWYRKMKKEENSDK